MHVGPPLARRCHLLCNQQVAIVSAGKCGACARSQPGSWPYCSPEDAEGVAPVCGADGVTYRNGLAAAAAGAAVKASGGCANGCGEAGEACYHNASGAGSTCCAGLVCAGGAAAADVAKERSAGWPAGHAAPGVCTRR